MDRYRPFQPIGRFYGGLVTVRQHRVAFPLFGTRDVIAKLAAENPREMLEAYAVKPGEFAMFAAYGTEDEFNIDAMTESFVAEARKRGLAVKCVRIEGGKHDRESAKKALPSLCAWLDDKLQPYWPGKGLELAPAAVRP